MKLKEYIYSQLSNTFFPIFLGLYFITSIVFLVKISQLTSVITISFTELLTLYAYVIPSILFYTLPISFFVSLVISLGKLSSEYELVVITSFGLNPMKILKILFPVTFIMSLALLILSVGLIPKTKHLTNVMLTKKKKEANFNIKSSEFGQKFGDWLIYIEDQEGKTYNNVKLFKTEEGSEQFILSSEAKLTNEKGELNFELGTGSSFYLNDNEINQINFFKMNINDTITDKKLESFDNPIEYWKNKFAINDDINKLTFYILTSIFPLISLLFVISFGYFNPRYEKNKSVSYAVLCGVIFYVLADVLAKKMLINALYVMPAVWIAISYLLYRKKVKEVY